jgi:peptidoglycan/LPS O-acetylase OafA/YrhL
MANAPETIARPDEKAKPRVTRFFSLDILRGVACLLVLVGHMPMDYDDTGPVLDAIVSFFRRQGWLGVDLFFVLSGLLISGLLFKEIQARGKIDLKRFWLRRGFKIWPAYYFAFGLMVVSGMWHTAKHHQVKKYHELVSNILPNMFFVQNYMDPKMQWPHSWSLAVEEHFYLALPLILATLLYFGKIRWLPGVVAAACLGILACRLGAAHTQVDWQDIKYPTHLRADALMFGVFLGYLFAYYPKQLEKLKPFWPLALLASIAVCTTVGLVTLRESLFVYAFGFTVIYLIFGSLVLMARLFPDFGRTGPAVLKWPMHAIAFIGVYSYTIYLAHGVLFKLPIARNLLQKIDHSAWQCTIFVFGSIAGGIALSHLIERPFLKLRERLVPASRTKTTNVDPVVLPMITDVPVPTKRAA